MSDDYFLDRSLRQSHAIAFDGVTQVYGPFDFQIYDILDVEISVRQLGSVLWMRDTAVKVDKGSADPDFFTITFDVARPATHEFRVRGKRLHERSVALAKGQVLKLDELSREHQKIGIVLQEVRRDLDASEGAIPDQLALAKKFVTDAAEHAGSANAAATLAASEADRSTLERQRSETLYANMDAYRAAFENRNFLRDLGSVYEEPDKVTDLGDVY